MELKISCFSNIMNTQQLAADVSHRQSAHDAGELKQTSTAFKLSWEFCRLVLMLIFLVVAPFLHFFPPANTVSSGAVEGKKSPPGAAAFSEGTPHPRALRRHGGGGGVQSPLQTVGRKSNDSFIPCGCSDLLPGIVTAWLPLSQSHSRLR